MSDSIMMADFVIRFTHKWEENTEGSSDSSGHDNNDDNEGKDEQHVNKALKILGAVGFGAC